MLNKTVTGKPALLMAAGSGASPTENCICCGKFMPRVDRLPTVRGFAHAACLLTATVRS